MSFSHFLYSLSILSLYFLEWIKKHSILSFPKFSMLFLLVFFFLNVSKNMLSYSCIHYLFLSSDFFSRTYKKTLLSFLIFLIFFLLLVYLFQSIKKTYTSIILVFVIFFLPSLHLSGKHKTQALLISYISYLFHSPLSLTYKSMLFRFLHSLSFPIFSFFLQRIKNAPLKSTNTL